jgi:alpha-beta hydrolase superfamily lysophospholipase
MYPNLPKFALGLSLGGLTSYYLTLENPHLFDGAILMAPAIKNLLGGKIVKLTKIL